MGEMWCHAHGEAGIYIQIATKLGGPFEAGGWDEKKEPRMKKRRGREGWERCGGGYTLWSHQRDTQSCMHGYNASFSGLVSCAW